MKDSNTCHTVNPINFRHWRELKMKIINFFSSLSHHSSIEAELQEMKNKSHTFRVNLKHYTKLNYPTRTMNHRSITLSHKQFHYILFVFDSIIQFSWIWTEFKLFAQFFVKLNKNHKQIGGLNFFELDLRSLTTYFCLP